MLPMALGIELMISVLLLALFSGMGSYFQGVRTTRIKGGFLDFMAEIILAVVVGLIVAYLCESQLIDRRITCALVLIFSNNGADTITKIRSLATSKLASIFNFGGKDG